MDTEITKTEDNSLDLRDIAERIDTSHKALEGLAQLLCVASATRQGSEFEGVGNLAYLIVREQETWVNRLMELAYGEVREES